MRDRLTDLQEIPGHPREPMEYAESTISDSFSNVDLEEELPHEAVMFDDSSPALSEVFTQSQDIHKEVQLIRLEVKRLREQNSRMLHGTTNMSTIKRDSNAIGADIKSRAENVLAQLHSMDDTAHKLEETHGSNSAVTRIARTQYACLSNGFRDAMFDYNEAEMSHRENCKAQIQRQMEIVGREVTGEEVEEMIEAGKWNIFNDNIVTEGKTALSALSQVEKRHQELLDLENRVKGIHEIFLDIALLVEEQGPMLNDIQTNVQKTDEGIKDAIVKIGIAKRHDNSNPFKKMFCSCFPCFKMRDMLEKLHTFSQEEEDDDDDDYEPDYDVDKVSLSQQAVTFNNSSAIDDVLNEAHSIRKEISLLKLEVERLKAHNERFGTSTRRLTLLKKDSDSIARGIQHRGESLCNRLQALNKESKTLEETEGPHAAISRIARVQHDTLTRAFQAVMSGYNETEEMQRETCRVRIQRQASILGKKITDEHLDELVDKGGEGWAELSQSLQTSGARSSRWALCEIKSRHKELVELEARLKEIHELFLQMAILVEEQGCLLNNIEAHVCGTEEHVQTFNEQIKKAIEYKKKNPFLQCCPCLPCWKTG
ncbi:syntaxin-11b.1 [Pholidichthys leucotaenia]